MKHTVRCFLLTAAVLAPTAAFGAVIQQVSCQSGCTTGGCSEGCNAYGGGNCNSCDNGAYCDSSGRCNMRSTRRDFATNWCGPCGPTGRLAKRGCKLAQTACWCCNTKAFPDSGWAPPTNMPINRTGTGFQNFMSNGGPYAGAPMVYQPTDTTQLGYSYAHVPTWQRNPGMVPPTPIPSNFHGRFCPSNQACGSSYGGCQTGGGMMGGYPMGEVVNEQMYSPAPSSCQDCQSGYMSMQQMQRPVQPAHANFTTQAQPVQARPTATALKQTPKVQQASQTVVRTPSTPAQKPVMKTQSQTQPNRQSAQKSAARPQARSAQQSSSGGWLGLPSLAEMKF